MFKKKFINESQLELANCVTSNAIVKLRYRSGKGQGQEGQSQDQLRVLKTLRYV